MNSPTLPLPLKQGDKVVILSPSSIIQPQIVYNAIPVLAAQGWNVSVGEHTFDRHGTFAGTDEARYDDLKQAFIDPEVRAIFCSRGGYGAVRLLERLNKLPLGDDPKWLVGYSDISALHALMSSHGIVSVHSPMCKHLAADHGNDPYSQRLFSILKGEKTEIISSPLHPYNHTGRVTGTLAGGNLAVITSLLGTPFDIIKPGTILFIEDIAEPIYKVERMLYTLRLSGRLASLAGLIVGQFIDYTPSRDFESMEQMIARMVEPYSFPVAFGFPIGHVKHNIPLLCNSTVTLTVTSTETTLENL